MTFGHHSRVAQREQVLFTNFMALIFFSFYFKSFVLFFCFVFFFTAGVAVATELIGNDWIGFFNYINYYYYHYGYRFRRGICIRPWKQQQREWNWKVWQRWWMAIKAEAAEAKKAGKITTTITKWGEKKWKERWTTWRVRAKWWCCSMMWSMVWTPRWGQPGGATRWGDPVGRPGGATRWGRPGAGTRWCGPVDWPSLAGNERVTTGRY